MSGDGFQLISDAIDAAKLMVSMRFVADRFVTELCLMTDQATVPLLRSQEGTADQTWPLNGPLQEVVTQNGDKNTFLAGVGKGGKSHWSVTVMPIGATAGFEFDFACRAKIEPDWLGSTYQVLVPAAPVVQNDERIEIPVQDYRLVCRALEFAQVTLGAGGEICFAAESADVSLPRTVRWKYRFELQ